MIELTHGAQTVGILPEIGGALAYWRNAGREILHPVSDSNLRDQHGVAVAGYPLIPYSNRIANGRFSLNGKAYRLEPNMSGEPHSIHGNSWQHAWNIIERAQDRVLLAFSHEPKTPAEMAEWPFPYDAVLSFLLDDLALQIRLDVTNCAEVPQPVGFGYHPFFAREKEMRVFFKAEGFWKNDAAHLPAEAIRATGDWDFSKGQPVAARTIDNCFYGWTRDASLLYPDAGYKLHITATDLFGHLVMFTAPDKPFVALEAVTNMTNAIHQLQCKGHGLVMLYPGQTMSGTNTFHIEQIAHPTR